MQYKPVIVMLTVLGALSAGTYYWLSQPVVPPIPAHAAIVLDSSDSVDADAECEALRGLLLRALQGHHPKGTKIFVAFTGSPQSAMEPEQLGVLEIPFSSRVMEGGEALKRARLELLAGMVESCKKNRSLSRSSPVFLAVKRAVEQLKAAGCNDTARCSLFVRTDGEETEETWLRESLKTGRQLKKGRPTPLDNKGIKVALCGLSETRGLASAKEGLTGKRNAQTAELVTAVWRKVFVEPDSVMFEPFCPRAVQTVAQKSGW